MRTNASAVFRFLILAHFAAGLICYVVSMSETGNWRQSDPTKAVLELSFWALDIATAVGLWLFRRWAKWLFIALVALSLVEFAARRMPITLGPGAALGLLEYLLAGAIISMSL